MDSPDERQPPEVITSDTNNATNIQPKEAPPKKRAKFRRFRAYNTGMWNGPKRENKKVARRQDNLHRFDAIASSLDLNEVQKSRGRNVLDEIDIRDIGLKVDTIIFGICVHVANDSVDGDYRYYPDDNSKDNDELFSDVASSLGLSLKQQQSILSKLRFRVDF